MNTIATLQEANQLFREGKYPQALKAYEALQRKDPSFSVYARNIKETRRHLLGGKISHPAGTKKTTTQFGQPDVTVHFLQVMPLILPLPEMLDKLCFYIQALSDRLEAIHIYLDAPTLVLAQELSETTLPAFTRLRSRLQFYPLDQFKNKAETPTIERPSILYIFDMKVLSDISKQHHARICEFQKLGAAWRIHDEIQHHGSFYLRSLESYFSTKPAIDRLQNRLRQLKNHPNVDRAVVAGTGPSLKYIYALDELDRSLVITCNSAIYNPTLMQTLQPHIVCATDPIFHAGWGKYGSEFRNALLKRLDEFDFILVVPTRDYHIYLDFLPIRLHERICCYKLDSNLETFNIDLVGNPVTKSTPNVLTNIMLPLAATLSKHISVVGCDGKKESSGYFWAHDPSSQINKHMGDIQKEFKGFFDIDYDAYYVDHCNTLDELLKVIELKGAKVLSRTPSWIPTLSRRSELPTVVANVAEKSVDVSVIMPARDAAETLEATCISVDKAASKGGVRARIIVIDDASIDDTANRARDFGKQAITCDVVVVHTKGLGVSGARNAGMGFINSRYTCFLDADDFFSEDSLASRIQVLESALATDPNTIGSFSRTRLVDINTQAELSVSNNYKKPGRRYRFEDAHSPAHISSILYLTEAVESIRFDYGRHYGEDWLFLAQVLAKGGNLIFDTASHTVYSINPESATKRNPHAHILSLFSVLEIIYTGRKLDCQSGSTLTNGLSGIGAKPNLQEKKSELLARLIGTLIAQRNFTNARLQLNELLKMNIINKLSLDLIEENPQNYTEIIKREALRFTKSSANLSGDYISRCINAMRLPDFLPNLSLTFNKNNITQNTTVLKNK